ncbi:hypothetical protein HJC23_004009 [Cyclotella cryptica]|uniref:Pyridoxamine 5'-phosphate oxidase Alr4036 family FMN-binding domain-containing protein n=1 Tax=Cyclotella cryptica TaxID=29204 RepID=A0ABD3QTL9_9STRA
MQNICVLWMALALSISSFEFHPAFAVASNSFPAYIIQRRAATSTGSSHIVPPTRNNCNSFRFWRVSASRLASPRTFARQGFSSYLRPFAQTPFCEMSSNSHTNSEDVGLTDAGGSSHNKRDQNEAVMNWKSRIDISIAKSRKIRGSNYVQISTVDHTTMEPRCRTVVFRGFMKNFPSTCDPSEASKYGDCVMKMITDSRSNKVKEMESFHKMNNTRRNNVEMVWWFPKSSEQYRIRGELQFIGNQGSLYPNNESTDGISNNSEYLIAERKQQWGNLSDPAREQFFWENPGIPYTSTWATQEGIPAGGRDAEGKVLPPPDTFLLMLLYPFEVDYLRLGDNFRQVDKWGDGDEPCESNWLSVRVNP